MTAPTCTYWDGPHTRWCGAVDGIRRHLQGERCPAHSPAALAQRGQPDNPTKAARRAA